MLSGKLLTAAVVISAMFAIAFVVRSAPPAVPVVPKAKANLNFVVKDSNGNAVNLASFAGKPLLLNMWATWCGPCKIETPQLMALADKYRDRGLAVVGLNVDDDPEDVLGFAKEFKVNYPMLVGKGQTGLLEAVGYEGELPLSLLIMPDGTINEIVLGLHKTPDWERMIEALFQ
jgi:thiol-disulfide isomerase/thioredoxin